MFGILQVHEENVSETAGSSLRRNVAFCASNCTAARTVPYRPYRTVSYRTVPQSTVPYHTVPQRTVPYRTLPYRTVPYATVPYRTVPCRTVPYRTAPYRTVPYCTLNQLCCVLNLTPEFCSSSLHPIFIP